MKAKTIWKELLQKELRYIVRIELKKHIGNNSRSENIIKYLLQHGYLIRVLKGIYYIIDPEEREMGTLKSNLFEMVANALRLKGVNRWYFGLDSGLRLNGMKDEFSKVETVFTDSFRTTKVIRILGTDIIFLKWSRKRFGFGEIEEENGVRRSDKEKTFLDLVYKRFSNRRDSNEVDPEWIEKFTLMFIKDLNLTVIREYLRRYPAWVGAYIRPILLDIERPAEKDDITQLKAKITKILKHHGIRKASVFGSIITDKFDDESDVDLIIEPKDEWSLMDLASIKIELEDSIGRKVDILTYRSLHPRIKEMIQDKMEVLI
jgi:predicted nucleotidyltransferase